MKKSVTTACTTGDVVVEFMVSTTTEKLVEFRVTIAVVKLVTTLVTTVVKGDKKVNGFEVFSMPKLST